MDLLMPAGDGISAIAAIVVECPEARILALTGVNNETQVVAALQAGALGYLLKDAAPEDVVRAARAVARGEVFLPSNIARQLVTHIRREPALTPREREIQALLAQNYSNREIARQLVLSESTVRVHVAAILRKLGGRSRDDVIRLARANPTEKS
jgi:DNA-binding NarL/FixJ family response regulator